MHAASPQGLIAAVVAGRADLADVARRHLRKDSDLRGVAAPLDVRAAGTVAGFTPPRGKRSTRVLGSGVLGTREALPLRIVTGHTGLAAYIGAFGSRRRTLDGLERTRGTGGGCPGSGNQEHTRERKQCSIHTKATGDVQARCRRAAWPKRRQGLRHLLLRRGALNNGLNYSGRCVFFPTVWKNSR